MTYPCKLKGQPMRLPFILHFSRFYNFSCEAKMLIHMHLPEEGLDKDFHSPWFMLHQLAWLEIFPPFGRVQ